MSFRPQAFLKPDSKIQTDDDTVQNSPAAIVGFPSKKCVCVCVCVCVCACVFCLRPITTSVNPFRIVLISWTPRLEVVRCY